MPDFYGSAKVEQGKEFSFEKGSGEAVRRSVLGRLAELRTEYERLKAFAQVSPTISGLSLKENSGLAELTYNEVDPAQLVSEEIENGITIYWEVMANEYVKRVEQHEWFTENNSGGAPLQGYEVREVYDFYDNPGDDQNHSGEDKFTGKQLDLWRLLAKGYHEYFQSAFVLRQTKTISGTKLAAIAADFANINKTVQKENLPGGASIKAIIDKMPAGEWLYKAPQLQRVTSTKWRLQREWWWAEKWNNILYDGTGDPQKTV